MPKTFKIITFEKYLDLVLDTLFIATLMRFFSVKHIRNTDMYIIEGTYL